MQWYYGDHGQQKGPVEDAALDELVLAGVVRDDTLVWHSGLDGWKPHAQVRGRRTAPPVAAPVQSQSGYCGECGRPFFLSDLVAIGNVTVCAQCKPTYLQRLREGNARPVGSFRYAGFWIRFLARLIDGILLNVALIVVRIPLGLGAFGASLRPGDVASGAFIGMAVIAFVISIVAAVCYEIFFVSSKGATPGKMVLGLKIVHVDGSGLSLGQATGRYFAQYLSGIILAIGYIMAAFDEEKRALHDRICDTRVIHTR